MKALVIDTNVVSPHIAPLALKLAALLGRGCVKYVYYTNPSDKFRSSEVYDRIREIAVSTNGDRTAARELSKDADFVLENVRDFALMEYRSKKGLPTCYSSERWFKPIRIDAPGNTERAGGRGFYISGFVRMLSPTYLRMALRLRRLLNCSDKFIYLANGVYAAQDVARMCGLLNGDLSCLFRAPKLKFEYEPGGRVFSVNGRDKRYCLDKMRLWGYFVDTGNPGLRKPHSGMRRILWVGRMFGWKRLDTLIKAAGGLSGFELDIYGNGPDECKVKNLAKDYSNVHVYGSVLLSQVRELMREHDIYVLASDAFEGWGAVVNEALEEGLPVLGTYEAGACATMLHKDNLFHAGDWRTLRHLLKKHEGDGTIGCWSVRKAAMALVHMIED